MSRKRKIVQRSLKKNRIRKHSEGSGVENELLVKMDDNFDFEKAHEDLHSVK